LNHHKTASLTRKNSQGQKVAHTLIVGSQNWSTTGNDESDENMLTFRNRDKGIAAAEAFNKHFDEKIWRNSK
ncbi:MAG: phospholipase D-like domain-containing protein, partial [Bdellovibrionota bacterium]